jgi:thymidylate synthase (FAD)
MSEIKVELIDYMGTDLTPANAARVSFDKRTTWGPDGKLKAQDVRLIQFLARGCEKRDWDQHVHMFEDHGFNPAWVENVLLWAKHLPEHWTPFAHTAITLCETVPIFVARQRFKHKIGFVENEVSRRYVSDNLSFYVPDAWRLAAKNKKQGSSNEVFNGYFWTEDDICSFDQPIERAYDDLINYCTEWYERAIEKGICAEQARMALPQSMMTSYWTTGSLYAFAQAYIKRSDSHSQKEIQDLAKLWKDTISPLFPVSWEALTEGR